MALQDMDDVDLFSEFPTVSRKEWEEKIRNDSGNTLEPETLFWQTFEGFSAPPFLTREDRNTNPENRHPVTKRSGWKLCEPVYGHDPRQVNQSIKNAIKGGAEACKIRVHTEGHTGLLGGDISGVNLRNQRDAELLLDGIDTELDLLLDCGMASPLVQAMAENTNHPNIRLISLFDPYTYIAKHGRLPHSEENMRQITESLTEFAGNFAVCADGSFYHNCGATIVQELAITLAVCSEMLAGVGENSRKTLSEKMSVKLGIGPLYFPEMAKFRAIRLLLVRLLEVYNISGDMPVMVLAETGSTNKSAYHPYNNLLRIVSELKSAASGGAELILASPYDLSGAKSARITRNIHHVLREEASLSRVADPSAGSYYIEELTDTIAEKAWALFCEIENEGGCLSSAKNGFLQNRIAISAAEKEQAYRKRDRKLVGSNIYTNYETDKVNYDKPAAEITSLKKTVNETAIATDFGYAQCRNAFNEGASLGDLLPTILNPQKVLYQPLNPLSAASLFDDIRAKTEELQKMRDGCPSFN